MDIVLIVLIVLYTIIIILEIKLYKELDNLLDNSLILCGKLLDERTNIIKILTDAEITEEPCKETIKKIIIELDRLENKTSSK